VRSVETLRGSSPLDAADAQCPQWVESGHSHPLLWDMSIKGFLAELLGRGNPMPASEALFRHVDGTGTGYEADDLMSWSPTPEQEANAIGPLLDIHERYRSAEYPIGISNPASFEEIRALAQRLRAQGL
jgi:hypothetical protein